MANPFTHKKLTDLEDMAQKHGLGEIQEARFANSELETEGTGLSHLRVKPGKRGAIAHKHEEAEEVYVVIAGSGRMKLDDEIIEVTELDAIRISPDVVRAMEAGDDGLEVLAFGPRHAEDRGEMVEDFWDD